MVRKIAILLMTLVFSSIAIADAGDKTVMLSGKQLSEKEPNKISIKALEADFTLQTVEIYNPWEKRKEIYTGIWVTDLIKKYGQGAHSLTLTAIDNYQVTLKDEDWQNLRILLATKVNGQYIDVKNKGPMRVVFPDYNAADKRYELSLPKWLWMIKQLEFN